MELKRELDALRLVVGTLTCGDVVAELGEVTHSLAQSEMLPAGVQLCKSAVELAKLSSLHWLRLASIQGLTAEVQLAIAAHRPSIMVLAGKEMVCEDVLGSIVAPGYCAMARVGAFLYLAPRTHCQVAAAVPTTGRSLLRAGARELLQTGIVLARAPVDDGLRSLHQSARQYRPPTRASRKLMKLVTDPERFLRDARSPFLSGVGANLVSLGRGQGKPTKARNRTTVFDFPKRSILIVMGADYGVDASAWAELCASLTLATEVVVVAAAGHEPVFATLLRESACPRLRVYLVADTATGRELLDYGIARCYAQNLAITTQVDASSADAIAEAFTELREDKSSLVVEEHELVLARRSVLRDHASGATEHAELAAALERLAGDISGTGEAEPLSLDTSSAFFRYVSLALAGPFSTDAQAQVVCLERRPSWPYPGSLAVRAQRPRVSVIMTVYNAAETVAPAIASVLRQSYRNFELLVVDDGSNDGSLDLLLKLARSDARIRVLQTANNSGTYVAKNIGLRFAQGEYVTFHDADDVSAGNRLALQVEALDSDPLAIGNYTRYQRVSKEGREVWFDGKTNRPGYITLLFRRQQVLDAVGFFDSVRISADAELVNRLRIATGRPVRLLPFVSYFALQAEGSLTTAGTGAFATAADGKMAMPPVRQAYRDAADAWHRDCFAGRASPRMPFPLGRRPFAAPLSIVPARTRDDDKGSESG